MASAQNSKPTAIVVGAGTGGIASAARLAKAGFSVTVLEKNAFTGGRCSLIHHDGYRFDQGPSLLLLPDMFQQAFSDLGTSMEGEGVELLKCEPNYNLWFGDGGSMQLSTDMGAMKREVERWEGKDGFERYLGFLQEAHRHYELSVTHVLRQSFDKYESILRPGFLRHLFSLHPFESIYSRAARYFRTDRLRRAFTFGSMYMGMSPFDAPGTYSLLQYTELAEGIWYPRGGFHAVLEALVNVAKRLGVEFRLNTPVKYVNYDTDEKGKCTATGVVLESGEHLSADVVLINADLVYAYNNFFPPKRFGRKSAIAPARVYAERLAKRATSCSSISFYWSLDRKIPQLGAHNIFLADDYKESFDSIFKDHVLPAEPSFYVNVPSRVDSSAAPDGKDSLVVLVPCGHLLEEPITRKEAYPDGVRSWVQDGDDQETEVKATGIDLRKPTPKAPRVDTTRAKPSTSIASPKSTPKTTQDFPALAEHARNTVIQVLNKRLKLTSPSAYPSGMSTTTYTPSAPIEDSFNLADHIIHEQVNDPLSWRERFNLDRGAILGLAHDFFNVLCFRPKTRHEAVKKCYFVGASTQPGTGVPIVLAGSRVVVGQICKDLEMKAPWEEEEKEKAREARRQLRHPLDVEGWLTYELLSWILLLLVPLVVTWFMFGAWKPIEETLVLQAI